MIFLIDFSCFKTVQVSLLAHMSGFSDFEGIGPGGFAVVGCVTAQVLHLAQ